MKKKGNSNSKLIALLLLIVMVVAWFVICKPLGDSNENFDNSNDYVVEESSEQINEASESENSSLVAEVVEPEGEEQNVEITDQESNDLAGETVEAEVTEENSQPEVIEQTEQLVETQVDVQESETQEVTEQPQQATEVVASYKFRNSKLLNQHYEKHGIEMGFASAADYEAAASAVITNPNALSKTEAEDGDFVYYVQSTNEFVVLSTDGYIRTYFNPSSGIKYYNKQ